MPEIGPQGTIALTVGVGLFIATGFAARWVNARRHLDLSSALDAPWWLFPLMRFAIYLFFKRQGHKDLYVACGFYKTEDRKKVPTRGPLRLISIRQGDDGRFRVKIRVKRGFPQGDEETDDGKINPKQEVINQAKGTMGLGPVDATWKFRLWANCVILTPKKVVPKEALYDHDEDVRTAFHELSSKDKVVIAIGKGDRPIVHSQDHDAPHTLLSASTMGGGKTATLRNFGVQQYLHGGWLLIIDTIKKHSHTGWAIDPTTGDPWPRILYADEIDEASEAIVAASREMDRRNAKVKAAKRQGRIPPDFPRLLILIDDMNGFTAELKRLGHKAAIHHLSLLLWAGREVHINIVAAFQSASAQAAGGRDVRECFGLRILAENSDKTGRMLADQVKDMPRVIPHKIQPGHSVMVYASLAIEAQRIFIEEATARRLVAAAADCRAMGTEKRSGLPDAPGSWGGAAAAPDTHRPVPPPAHSPSRSGCSVLTPDNLSTREISSGSAIDRNDGGIEYTTLSAAAARAWCPYTPDTLARYARDPKRQFPPPVIPARGNIPGRYSEREIQEWCERRRGRESQEGYQPVIYFILPGGRPVLRYGAIIKIGKTINLTRRVDEFANHPDDVIDMIPCDSEDEMDRLEKELHDRFDGQRVYPDREWFRVEGRLAESLGVREEVPA